ncbi:hypothetical protein ACHAQA_007702 [Verticillium albo-atrum]
MCRSPLWSRPDLFADVNQAPLSTWRDDLPFMFSHDGLPNVSADEQTQMSPASDFPMISYLSSERHTSEGEPQEAQSALLGVTPREQINRESYTPQFIERQHVQVPSLPSRRPLDHAPSRFEGVNPSTHIKREHVPPQVKGDTQDVPVGRKPATPKSIKQEDVPAPSLPVKRPRNPAPPRVERATPKTRIKRPRKVEGETQGVPIKHEPAAPEDTKRELALAPPPRAKRPREHLEQVPIKREPTP